MPLTPRDRKALMVGGIVLGVLIVGLVAFTFLSGGGDEAASEPGTEVPIPSGAPESPSVSETPSPGPSPSTVPNFTGRDPFSIPPGLGPSDSGEPPPSCPGSPDCPPEPPTCPGSPDCPPEPPTCPGSPDCPPEPPSCPGSPDCQGNGGGGDTDPGPKIVIDGRTVTLLDVFSRSGIVQAQVSVGSTVYTVRVGQTFAGGEFQLRSIVGGCATFLHGDEAFTLCVQGPK